MTRFSPVAFGVRSPCRRFLVPSIVVWVAVAIAACGTGQDDAKDDDDAAAADVSDVGVFKPDTGADNVDTGSEADDVGDDDAGNTITDPGDTGEQETPCDPKKAQVSECGWPCAKDSECYSDVCIPTRAKFICSMTCSSDTVCPNGWSCRQVKKLPDIVFACVDISPNVGRPCMSDLDCVEKVGFALTGVEDRCVSYGDEGAFCGRGCSSGQKCPTGFACKTSQTLAGEKTQQCVADKLEDVCTDRFVPPLDNAKTTCRKKNKLGTCSGDRFCAKTGLSPCSAADAESEKCDNKDNDCDGQLDELDGSAGCLIVTKVGKCPGTPVCFGGQEKCLGTPPSPEACNDKDDDCDGETDEGCDDDHDGYCDAKMLVDPGAKVCIKGGGDCKDKDAGTNPGQKEVCNGVDDNCNGLVDAADPLLPVHDPQSCEKQGGVCKGAMKAAVLCQGGKWKPCDADTYGKNSPFYAAKELCDDKDNDCSGKADEGCDADKDGYCNATKATVGFPLVCPKGGGDCNDELKSVHPNGKEHCDDADNDCNGSTDDGCDKDNDGWCDDDRKTFGGPKACPKGGGDCDDLSKAVHPKAVELCNGKDDDCSGQTDETFAKLGKPCAPGSGGCKATGKFICAADGKSAMCSVAAGKAGLEICDGKDNDCDDKIDEGCDDDGDDYCDANMATLGKPKSCTKGGGDCDDTNPKVGPSAKELCNGKDDDCDGKTDGKDGDMYFDAPQLCEKQKGACKGSKKPLTACIAGKWQPCTNQDYATWHPQYSSVEVCDNVDNDCDGKIDEGCDDDDDGYCVKGAKIVGFPTACKNGANDCNDENAAVHPFAKEVCDDKDNDCNNQIDEGCDKDFDGFCDKAKTTLGTPKSCPKGGGDCNDKNATVNPGAQEVCGDFVDQDCKSGSDQGCPPTIVGFSGVQGPNFYGDKLLQCSGFLDVPNKNDVPPGWGVPCGISGWDRIRIACGASPSKVRWIELNANPFRDGIPGGSQAGKITKSNWNLGGKNLISAIGGNPNTAQSWWVDKIGCSEKLGNLIVNHPSCPWEVANCFGQNLSGPRYLFVYVGK